ncbi:hypothetical protein [Pajaroellobacter abortibovis]|uniref:Uncharacterized protein n=1 Tax=Pajaroellobacter abortibovis TaxID=1882918 RepID=A0A1L6MYT7_9BACT|nr:hypothetical protein [Pajaroellobacter abortibovis]APS00588.1 hypothetical protein BCY86_07810 [Pajaroellobacter abortibovis]
MRILPIAFKFAVFNLAHFFGLLFSYGHQAHASACLSTADFAFFSLWHAYMGIFFMLGSFAQYSMNYFSLSSKHQIIWRKGSTLFAIFSLFLLAVAYQRISFIHLAILSIALNVGMSGWLGQLQRQMAFERLSFILFISFGVRFVLPFCLSIKENTQFFLATPFAFAMATLALTVIGNVQDSPPKTTWHYKQLLASSLLALCTTLFPVMDILAVSHCTPPSTSGLFAQISLFTRVPYYVCILIMQLTLPYRISIAQGHSKTIYQRLLTQAEGLCILAIVLVAPFTPTLVPFAAKQMVGKALYVEPVWLILSTFCFGALVALYREIQVRCTRLELRLPSLILVIVIASLVLFTHLQHEVNITYYMKFALFIYIGGVLALQGDRIRHWFQTR